MEHTRLPGWRDGKPRIITQGILDGDAVVHELFPMQTVVFDARASTFQSIPLPIFDSQEHRVGVLSLMTKQRDSFSSGSRARIWIQNAYASDDDPQLTFAADETADVIQTSTVCRAFASERSSMPSTSIAARSSSPRR